MRKKILPAFTVTLFFVLAGCGSTEAASSGRIREIPPGLPAPVNNFLATLPQDALFGVGEANLPNWNHTMMQSAHRARTDLFLAASLIMEDIGRHYFSAGELEGGALASSQYIVETLVGGARIAFQTQMRNGDLWTVVVLDGMDIVAEINQALAEARLAAELSAGLEAGLSAFADEEPGEAEPE
ncbi:MAG: hypothetical protein FWG66_13320 [Spirochaetes bacterium]|nr:hypothetical protein [Spirochaetota bacterium]